MATPKPGEIRCPTCHRSTAPAAFCTQCGSAIPSDARARPRGMDRDELQERIRARRSGGEPYRRGGMAGDEARGYQRFEPEPEDLRARPAQRGDAAQRRDDFDEAPAVAPPPYRGEPAPRRDLTRDVEDDPWADRTAVPATPPAEEPAYVDNFDDEAYADEPYYDYDEWAEGRERRSGGGALAILGFLALGVMALLGGAVLAGVFVGDPGVGQIGSPSPTASPSIVASEAPSASPTADGSPGGSPDATGGPTESGEPTVFPDGFTAEAQPCLPGSADIDGCDANAASNSGSVQIWVGFQNGTGDDVIGAALIGPEGNTVGTGSIDLDDINCTSNCNGYTFFNFSNLEPGTYEVEITRNGQRADTTTFVVE
jgi:hypothetical protein